jgi:hypothetical protein
MNTIANIVMASFTVLMFIFVVWSFQRTLKEGWRNNVILAATDYIRAVETLRTKKAADKYDKADDSDKSDNSKLYGDTISAQKQLKMLLFKKKSHNVFDLAEKLRGMADKGELYNSDGYGKTEDDFIEAIFSILK